MENRENSADDARADGRPEPGGEPEFCRAADAVVLSASRAEPRSWVASRFRLPDLWAELGTRGEGARVAVIDTGVNTSHPDLRHVVAHDCTGQGPEDRQGHGTHCCGIVGAKDSPVCCGAAPDCELHSFRVFDDAGACRVEWVNRALRDIASGRHGRFDVVSMSLGSERPSEEMRMIIMGLCARGVVVMAAAGNDGAHTGAPHREFGTIGYPAAFGTTISVGSTNSSDRRSAYSSTGNKLVVTGPGEAVASCWIEPRRYATISGTSMACPFVAGCVALLVSRAKKLGLPRPGPVSVAYALAVSSNDLEAPGYDFNTGFGAVDPRKLVRAYEQHCREAE